MKVITLLKKIFVLCNGTNCQNLHFDITDNQMTAAQCIAVSTTLFWFYSVNLLKCHENNAHTHIQTNEVAL